MVILDVSTYVTPTSWIFSDKIRLKKSIQVTPCLPEWRAYNQECGASHRFRISRFQGGRFATKVKCQGGKGLQPVGFGVFSLTLDGPSNLEFQARLGRRDAHGQHTAA